MEELFAYAVFMRNGLNVEDEFNKLLDELFLNDLDNNDYLELEMLSGNSTESISYIFVHSDTKSFDIEKFGKIFISLLYRYYELTINKFCNCLNYSELYALEEFGEISYDIWESLPDHFQIEEPFNMLLCVDDPLSYVDVERSKELYNKIFNYYK